MSKTAEKRPLDLEEEEEDLKLSSNEPLAKIAKVSTPEEDCYPEEDLLEEIVIEEEEVKNPVRDEFAEAQEQRRMEKMQLLAAFERCEKLGGDDFEAEQQRVLNELSKQRDTIKALLDDMRASKAEFAAQSAAPTAPKRSRSSKK